MDKTKPAGSVGLRPGSGGGASAPNVGLKIWRGTTDGKGTIGESSMSRAEVTKVTDTQVVTKVTDAHKLWYASDDRFYK